MNFQTIFQHNTYAPDLPGEHIYDKIRYIKFLIDKKIKPDHSEDLFNPLYATSLPGIKYYADPFREFFEKQKNAVKAAMESTDPLKISENLRQAYDNGEAAYAKCQEFLKSFQEEPYKTGLIEYLASDKHLGRLSEKYYFFETQKIIFGKIIVSRDKGTNLASLSDCPRDL